MVKVLLASLTEVPYAVFEAVIGFSDALLSSKQTLLKTNSQKENENEKGKYKESEKDDEDLRDLGALLVSLVRDRYDDAGRALVLEQLILLTASSLISGDLLAGIKEVSLCIVILILSLTLVFSRL